MRGKESSIGVVGVIQSKSIVHQGVTLTVTGRVFGLQRNERVETKKLIPLHMFTITIGIAATRQ